MLDVILVLFYAGLALAVTAALHEGTAFSLEVWLALIAVQLVYWGLDTVAEVTHFKIFRRRRVIQESLRILKEHGFPNNRPFDGLTYDLYLYQVRSDVGLPDAVRKAAGELQMANQISADINGNLRTRLIREAQNEALASYTRVS